MSEKVSEEIIVRNTLPEDFSGIIEMTKEVYPKSSPWHVDQLSSHLKVFPEGQFVAIESKTGKVVGMAASLIIWWDDYDVNMSWRDFTEGGFFTNHDPVKGKTLYGAEVMVHPEMQGKGIGNKLYEARRNLVEELNLLRIRAGARLRGFHQYAEEMNSESYVIKVVNKELVDPTLSFQLHQGFHVLAVVKHYLHHDPDSHGYAAVIEWLNEKIAKVEDYMGRNPLFLSKK